MVGVPEDRPKPWLAVQAERDDALALEDGEEAVIEPLEDADRFTSPSGSAA